MVCHTGAAAMDSGTTPIGRTTPIRRATAINRPATTIDTAPVVAAVLIGRVAVAASSVVRRRNRSAPDDGATPVGDSATVGCPAPISCAASMNGAASVNGTTASAASATTTATNLDDLRIRIGRRAESR